MINSSRWNTLLIAVLFSLIPLAMSAQYELLEQNSQELFWYENALLRDTQRLHTAIRPWRQTELAKYDRRPVTLDDTVARAPGLGNWLKRKLLTEDFLVSRGEDHYFTLNPVVVFRAGQDSEADYDYTYRNSRGARLELQLGKVSAYTTLVETQARLPLHITNFLEGGVEPVVPSYWLAKPFRNRAYDFAYAAGEVAYTPNRNFHFRLGHGKQFIGEGYRSLLVSDNGVNYPFFRIETTFGRFRYVNTWAILNDLRPAVQRGNVFGKKYLAMHYLSVNIGKRINLGLFEGNMWGDELNRYGFDANFLNPVILYRPVEFAQGAAGGNTLMGLQASYQFDNGIQAYGQMALDEFTFSAVRNWSEGSWLNMAAWQGGLKWGDALGIRNLFLRAEYNLARPYIYSHREVLTNWSHYQQPLAHPWGANFRELLIHAHYRSGRWSLFGAYHMGEIGRNAEGENWGGDIFEPWVTRTIDTGVFAVQGQTGNLSYLAAELAFTLNPNYNLELHAGYRARSETTPKALARPDSRWFYFGLRTNVYTSYQDF